MKKLRKIYLLIQPVDYSRAFVDVYTNKKEAKQALDNSDDRNKEYWYIQEEEI